MTDDHYSAMIQAVEDMLVTNLNIERDLGMNRIDPIVVGAVLGWSPRTGPKPAVDLESWTEGLRVKLTYLGVETGVLFNWGAKFTENGVAAELDRVYDVLC